MPSVERFDFDTAKGKPMNRTNTAASRGNQQSIVNASAQKEKPILFSAPMVRAILGGAKTQTRRIVKHQPDATHDGKPYWNVGGFRTSWIGRTEPNWGNNPLMCPYGKAGERLWVREAFAVCADSNIFYRADGGTAPWDGVKWKPSIHMPRKASRITLDIVDVRAERLQDITRGDCMAEGCPFPNVAKLTDPIEWFAELWESINGNWDDNPLVWVVEFKKT